MICASRPNFYKANSSLSELFLHVSLNDLWLLSQFLQHKLIIKWNTLYMLRCMICGSRPNFCNQNAIIKWAALVAWLRLAADLARFTSRSRSATQNALRTLPQAAREACSFRKGYHSWPSNCKLFRWRSETY